MRQNHLFRRYCLQDPQRLRSKFLHLPHRQDKEQAQCYQWLQAGCNHHLLKFSFKNGNLDPTKLPSTGILFTLITFHGAVGPSLQKTYG